MRVLPPSLDDIETLARAAWEDVPESFRKLAGDVLIRIEDFADGETLAELEIENPYELTGLYHGLDLTHQSMSDPAPERAMVFLYRRPILDEWIEHGDIDLRDLIAHVLVHEIAHHFGYTDEQIDAILDEED